MFGDGKTSLRGGYGIYFNTNNQQNLIVTVTNPPATPRIAIGVPADLDLPGLRFRLRRFCPFANSIRPVQFDLDNPYLNVYNLSIQRELPWDTVVTVGYAGSRGVHSAAKQRCEHCRPDYPRQTGHRSIPWSAASESALFLRLS